MSGGEFEWIVWWEVRRQDTFLDASAAQNLAGGARADHDGLRRIGGGRRRGVDGVAAVHLQFGENKEMCGYVIENREEVAMKQSVWSRGVIYIGRVEKELLSLKNVVLCLHTSQ